MLILKGQKYSKLAMHDIDIEGSPDRNPEIPQPEFTRALWWPLFCSVHSNRKSQKRKNPAEVTTIGVYVMCGHFLVSVFVLTHQQDMVSRQCPYHALPLLRIQLKLNTALLSTFRAFVRPSVTGVTSLISHIYKGINAMLIIRGPIKPCIFWIKSSWLSF